MKRSIWFLPVLIALGVACAKHEPLTKDQTIDLIRAAPAWSQSLDPPVSVDPGIHLVPGTRREIVRLEGLTLKDDGPGGMAGQTATGSFTWRWADGWLAGKTFRSRVKLNNNGSGWRVYNDELARALAASESADSE